MSTEINLDDIPKITRGGSTEKLFVEFKKVSEGKALIIIPKEFGCTYEGLRYAINKWNLKHRKKLTSSKRENGKVGYVYFK